MSRKEKYNKSLSEQWSIRLRTKHPDGDNYDGVITHIKPSFIVMREESSFEFDGTIILPKRSIKSVRDGKHDKCCNEILRQNGQIKRLRPARWLDRCETMADIFQAFMQRNIWPGVETNADAVAPSSLYIGPITKVRAKGFSIWCYDAEGSWESEYKIGYDEVFRIEIDSAYTKHFNEYMKGIDNPNRERSS